MRRVTVNVKNWDARYNYGPGKQTIYDVLTDYDNRNHTRLVQSVYNNLEPRLSDTLISLEGKERRQELRRLFKDINVDLRFKN
jgi:RecJ-like exonuclease